MADVVPYVLRQMVCLGKCYCHLICGRWLNHRGICYNLLLGKVADVIAIVLCVADGKPTKFHVTTLLILWQMLLPSGRWNGH